MEGTLKKTLDILPPYPQKKHHHFATPEKKRRKLNKKIFTALLIVVFLLIAFFGFGQLQNFKTSPNATSPSSDQAQNTSQFELFNNQGQSSFSANPASIKLLDGSNNQDSLAQAKQLLLNAGFELIKTENTPNFYDQTTIFYKKENLSWAQNALNALKPSFDAKLQESTDLDQNTDIVIVVGAK